MLKWVINKWDEEGVAYDLEKKDSDGNQPLLAVCLRGYLGSEGMAASSRSTKEKRLEVVKILLEHGADINIKSGIVEMTPLHWAAYNKDPNVVAHLLRQGAKMSFCLLCVFPQLC